MSSFPASATAARVSPAALSVLVPRRGLCPCAIDGAKVAVAVSALVVAQLDRHPQETGLAVEFFDLVDEFWPLVAKIFFGRLLDALSRSGC